MTEYTGVLTLIPRGGAATPDGRRDPPLHPYAGVTIARLDPVGLLDGGTVRVRAGGAVDCSAIGLALSVSHDYPTRESLAGLREHTIRDLQTAAAAGRAPPRQRTRAVKLKTVIDTGMYLQRDKLARIGVVATISGVPLANTDVILNGLEHREIVKTDHRGVWWRYLEIDEYPDALFVSPNGITYDLLKQIEREDNEGIFDQMVQRRTIANTGSRQLHRKFV